MFCKCLDDYLFYRIAYILVPNTDDIHDELHLLFPHWLITLLKKNPLEFAIRLILFNHFVFVLTFVRHNKQNTFRLALYKVMFIL